MPRTVLLTGVPRSGTTLCCHLLNQFPETVALHEPMDLSAFHGDAAAAVGEISKFAVVTRDHALQRSSVSTKQLDGAIPANPVTPGPDGSRQESVTPGEMTIDKPLSNDFVLVIKHNALFTALLPLLRLEFEIFALVRNPLFVLASWQSVSFPVADGRLPMGEKFDEFLAAELQGTSETLHRQLAILKWFFGAYAQLDPSTVLRYEDVITTNGTVLSRICGQDADLVQLAPQLRNSGLDDEVMSRLARLLIENTSVYSPVYSQDDIEAALEDMLS